MKMQSVCEHPPGKQFYRQLNKPRPVDESPAFATAMMMLGPSPYDYREIYCGDCGKVLQVDGTKPEGFKGF